MNPGPGQMASMHAHPLMWAFFPLVLVVVVISIIIVVRWLTSKRAWPYHPGGAQGFLRDELLRYASIWLPFAVAMVGVRYYIYAFHPDYIQSPYLYAFYLSIFVFRRLAGLLPHVKEIGARLDSARRKAREAEVRA